MKRFEPGTPRVAFGIVAIVMTTVTLALLVVVPAELQPDGLNTVVAAVSQHLS